MRTVAVVSLLAVAVYAQSSSAPSPLIPSGISTNCTSFLTDFDQDTTLQNCTSGLLTATAQFGPNGTATPSASEISSALSSVCSAVSSCSDTAIQSKLASFYAACTPELTSSANANVLQMYDVLYSLAPYTQALCSKDDSGNYCAAQISASSSSSNGTNSTSTESLDELNQSLWSTVSGSGSDAQSTIAIVPNATTFAQNNVLFLLLQPSLAKANLCTSCSRSILTAFINFESNVPYAAGLGNSPLLKGQSALYSAVQTVCGVSFLNGAVAAAAGLSGGILGSNGAAHMSALSTGAVGTVVGGAILALFASL